MKTITLTDNEISVLKREIQGALTDYDITYKKLDEIMAYSQRDRDELLVEAYDFIALASILKKLND